jgi:hypothetical protein
VAIAPGPPGLPGLPAPLERQYAFANRPQLKIELPLNALHNRTINAVLTWKLDQ